jgi:hypothetical protein
MRNTSILLAGVALAVAGAVATPSFAHTHHRHMASGHSTPAERQQTADLNRQQLAQAQNAGAVGSNAAGPATEQNSLTTEPTSYQRTRGSSGAMSPPAAGGTTGSPAGNNGTVGEDQQVGSPMNDNMQGNPSGAVSPPPPANPSGAPQQ